MRESASEKLKCGCPGTDATNRTCLGPIVNNLDESLEQIETNGTTTGPTMNTFDNRENLTKNGTLVGAKRSTSLEPCDEGPAGNSWNERVSCPKEHPEEKCLFLWNNGVTRNKEEKEEEVEMKEEIEETNSVHFFLEQLVGDQGWRECVEVKNAFFDFSDYCPWKMLASPFLTTFGQVHNPSGELRIRLSEQIEAKL